MTRLYIPPPTAEQFVESLRDMARPIARLGNCKITIRVEYEDHTFNESCTDYRDQTKMTPKAPK